MAMDACLPIIETLQSIDHDIGTDINEGLKMNTWEYTFNFPASLLFGLVAVIG